ncbi:MAG: hypothetical protein LBG43_11190 [Treponema sp.]|jgi:hypothetical protein|nr:hypothetical protein [Treponema sp.]
MFEEYEKLQMKAAWTSWKTSRFGVLHGFLTGVTGGLRGVVNFTRASRFFRFFYFFRLTGVLTGYTIISQLLMKPPAFRHP